MPRSDDGYANCPLFREMTSAERLCLESLLDQKLYAKNEGILREGKTKQFLWIIVRGSCAVLKSRKDGNEQQLAVLEPGAVFGEMSYFRPAPHSASIRTLSEVEVMCLSHSDFDQLQQICPTAADKLAVNIVSILAERLRKMDDWICELIERPDGQRHREEWREFRSKLYSGWQF